MKKTISGLVFLFAFAASLVAKGEAKNGNCKDAAVKITPSDSVQTAVLQREWDPYGGINGTGDWSDGGHQELAIGVKWYYAKLTKGKNYVLWMDDVGVAYDDLLSMSIEPPDYDSGQVADSLFAEYIDSAGSTFMYLTAETGYDYGQWSPNDPDECTFYICFSDNDVGKSAEFYLTEESIVNHVPAGALLNPIELNVSESGSVRVVKVPDEYSTHYRFSAEAGNHYVFTCSSYPTNMPSIQLSSVSGDQEAVNEEFRSWADGTTGTYVYDFSITNGTMTAVITVEADDPSLCDLSWVCTKVGIAGFDATDVRVRDDAGHVDLSVFRTSGDVAMRYRWMTVAETAVPGVDYIPASGELAFDADGELSAVISIPLIPGGALSSGEKVFAVRLKEIPEGDLGEDEYSPSPSPAVVRVTVVPTGADEPVAEVPAAVDEDGATPLATGTFEGVIVSDGGKSRFAEVVISSAADGTLSATVALDGVDYAFTGSGNVLSGSMTVGGTVFDASLNFVPPSGTVADLDDGPGDAAKVSGFLYVEASDVAEEVFFSGSLYRRESRLDAATLERMEEKAGRYVAALGFGRQANVTDTAGLLVVDVAADGTATNVFSALADGSMVTFAGCANDTVDGVALPIAWSSGGSTVAGTLSFDAEYDYWTSLDRLYRGWELVVNDAASPFDGLELYVEDGTFCVSDPAVSLSFDRARGVISGFDNVTTNSFLAVLITSAQANEIGVAGFAMDANGSVTPFNMQRVRRDSDPDWSEEWGVEVVVSFDPNGGVGTMPSINTGLGCTITLPACTFTKANYRFSGWRHPYSGAIYRAGDVVNVPASDSAFSATWEDVRIKAALDCIDCDELVFVCGDDTEWDVLSAAYAAGGTYVRSAASLAAEDGESAISTSVDSPGKFAFDWGLVRRDYWSGGPKPDRFEFVVDGETVLELSGMDYTSFTHAEYEIKESGTHSIAWKYVRSDELNHYTPKNQNAACVMLDAVVWEPQDSSRVLVTFDAGEYGVSSETNIYRTAGEPIGALPSASRVGCEFVGWVNSSGTAVTPSTIVPKRGLALFAKWSATVSFDPNGEIVGSVPASVSVTPGETMTLPGALQNVSDDFAFVGWRLGGHVYAAGTSSDLITSNVTFMAEWQDNRPTVTIALDPNGGICETSSIGNLKAGDVINELPTPTKAGAVFVAWYAGGERIELPCAVGRTNATFTAHWGVTLTFAAGGATGEVPADIAAEPGDTVTLPGSGSLSLENHLFTGWTDGSAKYDAGASYTVFASTTLTAAWKNAFYNTPLDNGELEFSSADDSHWQIVADASAEGGSYLRSVASLATQDGESTISTTVDCAGIIAFNWGLVRRDYWTGGVKPDTFALVVDGETVLELSGANYTSFTNAEFEIEGDGAHSITWKYVRSNKSGHYSLKNQNAACAMLDAVVWEPLDSSRVLVTFDAGEYGVSSETNTYRTAGEPIGALPSASRVGCDFVGWFDSEDVEIAADTIVPEGGFTLTAKWSATVSFNPNGDIVGNVPASVTVSPGETVTLPDALEHVSGDFEFVGWKLGSQSYGEKTSYGPVMSNITFVAEWSGGAPEATVTITLDANGGSCETSSIDNLKAGDVINELPTPTKNGAEFSGWYEGGVRVSLPYVVGGADVTFTARWTIRIEGFFNSALDNFELGFEGDSTLWSTNDTDASATGGTYVRSAASLATQDGESTISTTVDCAGIIAFNWGLVRRDYWTGGVKPDTFALIVDGETVLELSGANYTSFTHAEFEIEGDGAHSITWKYVRSNEPNHYTPKNSSDACAKLDAVVWTPSGISTAAGSAFEGADEDELAKATEWMDTNGISVADMNNLQFSDGNRGEALDTLAEAYLLDCAPTPAAVAAAKAAFRVESISIGVNGEPVVSPSDGESYSNGVVRVFYSASPNGEYSATKPETADSLFIKLHLIK